MKQVSDVTSHDQYIDDAKSDVIETTEKVLDEAFKKLSSFRRFILKWHFLIVFAVLIVLSVIFLGSGAAPNINQNARIPLIAVGALLFFLSFLLTYFFYRKRDDYVLDFKYSLDAKRVYAKAFNALRDDLHYVSLQKEVMPEIYEYKLSAVSRAFDDASIDWNSPRHNLTFRGSQISAQCVTWFRVGKVKNYVHQGLITFRLSEEEERGNDFNFSLFTRLLYSFNKIVTENKSFNKKVDFRSDDQMKARIFATPLSMEKILEHRSKIRSKEIGMEKLGSTIFIKFKPYTKSVLEFKYRFRYNVETLTKIISGDVLDDVYEIYSLLAILFIPPFFEKEYARVTPRSTQATKVISGETSAFRKA